MYLDCPCHFGWMGECKAPFGLLTRQADHPAWPRVCKRCRDEISLWTRIEGLTITPATSPEVLELFRLALAGWPVMLLPDFPYFRGRVVRGFYDQKLALMDRQARDLIFGQERNHAMPDL